jgi:hypothetical protein
MKPEPQEAQAAIPPFARSCRRVDRDGVGAATRDWTHDTETSKKSTIVKTRRRLPGRDRLVVRQPLLPGSVYVARREILDSGYNLSIAEAQLRAVHRSPHRSRGVLQHDSRA